MENNKEMWWRYPLAVLAFVAVCLCVPFVMYIVLYLLQLFVPKYYKSGEAWLYLVSYMFGAYMGYRVAFLISKGKDGFATALSILYAVYAIIVGTTNGMVWGEFPDTTIAYILSGIAIIGFQVFRLMNEANEAKKKQINGANNDGHNA